MVNRFKNFTIYNITCLLVCLGFFSCNTFDNIPGRYMYGSDLLQAYEILYMYPDSIYKQFYWGHGFRELCDSGIWIADADSKSIELRSTLPDLMHIPIDAIEDSTDSDGITIIFDRPYGMSNLLEWEITVDGNKLMMEQDTLWLNQKTVENISLAAACPEPLRGNFCPPFVNNEIKTVVYDVKNRGCNKFTIVLPRYAIEQDDEYYRIKIYQAEPLNKTIYWKELKKYKNYKEIKKIGDLRFLD